MFVLPPVQILVHQRLVAVAGWNLSTVKQAVATMLAHHLCLS